jgi:hypothetical protein
MTACQHDGRDSQLKTNWTVQLAKIDRFPDLLHCEALRSVHLRLTLTAGFTSIWLALVQFPANEFAEPVLADSLALGFSNSGRTGSLGGVVSLFGGGLSDHLKLAKVNYYE